MQIGTDIIEIQRIKEVLERKPQFAQRILSPAEHEIFQGFTSENRQMTFLAGRFAAKEAYGKALGTGVGTQLSFKDISIVPAQNGQPQVQAGPVIHPQAKISISHSGHYAVATALVNLSDSELNRAKENFGLKGDTQ